MKQLAFILLAVVGLASSPGCCCLERLFCEPWGCGDGCETGCDDGCSDCGSGGEMISHHGAHHGAIAGHGGGHLGHHGRAVVAPAGPPTGAVTYPYYTTRGPRDYLAKNPPGIGP